MKNKIITLVLIITLILIGKSEALILTQKIGSESMQTTVEEYQTVKMIFTSKEGFRFKRWVIEEGVINGIDLTSNEIEFEMPNSNITIKGEYDSEYIVTFNGNGGETSEGETTYTMEITAEATESLILNQFIRSGYKFKGWSEEKDETIEYTDGASYKSISNITLYAVWEIDKVTVEFNSNGGDEVGSIEVTYGGTYGELPAPTKSGYTFSGWYKDESLENEVTGETEVSISVTHTLYAKWKATWNEPVLPSAMKAVNWNGSSWTKLDSTDNWDYNYTIATAGTTTVVGDGTAMWANAVIPGTYDSYYVWIPRFTYKVTTGNGISWNSDTEGTKTAKTEIKFSVGTVDDTSGGYSKHSAFTLKDKNGNIVKELEGFWISKFEASNTSSKPLSRPGVQSWRNITASAMFNYGKNLNSSVGSHMLKDSEWGAVAYLTSAVGRIPYINDSSNFYTGNAGSSQNDADYVAGVTNAYNSVAGVKASTTHNIYGVYDMSGGTWEYTSAYYSGSTSSYISNLTSSYSSNGSTYVDYYTTTTLPADAAGLGWDSDGAGSLMGATNPLPIRGLGYTGRSISGIFGFGFYDGAEHEGYYGFRVALWGMSL